MSGKYKRIFAVVMLSGALFIVPASASVPVFRTDNFMEQIQISIQNIMQEITKYMSSLQGLQSLDGLKNLTGMADQFKKMFSGLTGFNLDFQKLLGGLFKDLNANISISGADMPPEVKKLFSEAKYREGAEKIVEAIIEKTGGEAKAIRSGKPGKNLKDALGGIDAGSKKSASEGAAKALEDLGKYTPFSVPGAKETSLQQVYGATASPMERATAAYAVAEKARSQSIEKSMNLMAPYIEDDSGKSAMDKAIEKLREEGKKVDEKLEKDAQNSGNELEVLRSIASMTAGMVQRQAITNEILLLNLEQGKDRIKMLSHVAILTTELYGASVEKTVSDGMDRISSTASPLRFGK